MRAAAEKLFEGHLPIVGLTKSEIPAAEKLSSVYITASFAEAEALAEAGADFIALDATGRKRADQLSLKPNHRKDSQPVEFAGFEQVVLLLARESPLGQDQG